jgi:hypothetical protein
MARARTCVAEELMGLMLCTIPSMRVMRSDHEYDLRVVDDRERDLGYSSMPALPFLQPASSVPAYLEPCEWSIRSGFSRYEDAVTGVT